MTFGISAQLSWGKNAYNGVFTVTQAFTVPAGSSQVLLLFRRSDKFETFSETVTYGGVAMTLLGASPGSAVGITRCWYLLAPTAGAANIVITTADQKNQGAYLAVVVDDAVQSAPAFTGEDFISVVSATSGATVAAGKLAIMGAVSNVVTGAAGSGSTSLDLNVAGGSSGRYGSAMYAVGAKPSLTMGSSSQIGAVTAVVTPLPVALAFTGTVPAQTGTVGTAIAALAMSSYYSGGTAPYAYSVSAGSLPPGLALNTSTGAITGTPTAAGSYSTTIRATDSAGTPATVDSNSFAWTTSVPAATATTLTGPSGGTVGSASAPFTIGLNGTGTATITPNDSGAGGTFSPSGAQTITYPATATFTYNALSAGAKTIGITDAGSLTDATSITYTASATAGTLTIAGLRNGSGPLLAGVTLPNVVVLQRSTRAVLLAATDQVTNGSGNLVLTSGALPAGTDCQVVAFSADGTQAGCWAGTVA